MCFTQWACKLLTNFWRLDIKNNNLIFKNSELEPITGLTILLRNFLKIKKGTSLISEKLS